MSNVLTMILAGGEGSRLKPLTTVRTKPAVPFGGNYRIIDFVLSNFVNSGLLKIFVLTQFKSHSLMQHLREGWRMPSGIAKQFIDPVPAQMRTGKKWYAGTADAIYQNMNLIEDEDPNAEAVAEAVDFAVKIFYRKPARFRKMIERAMKQRFTWTAAAEKYSALYQKTLNQGVK